MQAEATAAAAAAAAPRSGRQGLPDALKMLPMRFQQAAVAGSSSCAVHMEAEWPWALPGRLCPLQQTPCRQQKALRQPGAAQAAAGGQAAVGRPLGGRCAAGAARKRDLQGGATWVFGRNCFAAGSGRPGVAVYLLLDT